MKLLLFLLQELRRLWELIEDWIDKQRYYLGPLFFFVVLVYLTLFFHIPTVWSK